ncbi:hypothetical protein D5086_033704 [Populus alba]|uniref:Uncharacterized protein n=1 Tax=Populus alba TaxID=43335 RepID=A0ACC4AHK7_POPAL
MSPVSWILWHSLSRSTCSFWSSSNVTFLNILVCHTVYAQVFILQLGKPFSERKEKLGERIVALQQLVSPYGKTDTASVLMEAMEYIRFLHEQVQVLSAPYLQGTSPAQMQGLGQQSLESKGLCLVPISYTAGIARSNGADIWAPIKSPSPKFRHPPPTLDALKA